MPDTLAQTETAASRKSACRRGGPYVILKPARCPGVAARAGRCRWIVQSIARIASLPRCSATRASPSAAAISAATFFAVQTPPSSGGIFTGSRSIARISGVRIRGFAPFRRRRSPSGDGPKRL
jgi:hypothetical protein